LSGSGWQSRGRILEGWVIDGRVTPSCGPHVVGEGVEGVGEGTVDIVGGREATRDVRVTSLQGRVDV